MKNIIAFILVILAFGTAFYIFNQTRGSTENSADLTKDINKIELNMEGSDTTIIAEKRDDVKADLKGKGTLSVRENGDTIEVEVKQKWYQSFLSFGKSATATVYIPEDYDRDMEFNIDAGNLVFSGASEANPMKLDTVNTEMNAANVEFSHLNTAQWVLEVSAGKLTIDSLTTKEGSFDVSAGDVTLTRYTGPLEGDLAVGNMEVEMEKLVGDVRFDVNVGSVALDLPDKADFSLKGRSELGNISCDFPLQNQESRTGNISGKHGSGKYQMDVSVAAGEMEIY
ncbi:DUF4097 family beta strand repeat-containing protein [Bacillus sp. FJAT-42315]|uniref:DUF4097 family beta strand repeat-containing protein n=1 Tax=Bacillus sp. FJAT-42315 TaxID=2014077 RepID=UPI000C2511C8|nr:DUF4097 family beta strand repeat-containing protein [Bacillus sp. FJAT-42315]